MSELGSATTQTGGGEGRQEGWVLRAVLSGHDGRVRGVAFGEVDGRAAVASAGEDGTVRLWDVAAGEPRAVLSGHDGRVRGVAFGEVDGRAAVASAGEDGTVRLWDVAAGEPRAVLSGHDGRVRGVAFGEVDGRAAVASAGEDGTVRLWDVAAGEPRAVLSGHDGRVRGVAFGEVDGRAAVASAGEDGTVRLWDAVSHEHRAVVTGKESAGRRLDFDEIDGRPTIASAGEDGTLGLWDVATGDQRAVLAGHEGYVRGVAFGRVDGRPIVISADDGAGVRVWEAAAIQVHGQIEWVPDAPATEDLLNRKPVADMLARRLRRVSRSSHDRSLRPPGSFLVHLDGRWGVGKSSILNFLRDDLEHGDDPWIVVDFNAWQQAKMGPAWWALLTGLRRRAARDLGWGQRSRLRVEEAWQRVRATGAPYALTLVVLVAAASAVVLAVGPQKVGSAEPEQVAKAVTAIVVAVAAIWAGALVVGRFMLWDSATGARLFEQSNNNPMAYLKAHFAWLVQRTGRPVAFFIDDLDRCDQSYVVELLDGIQTLVRDAGNLAQSSTERPGGDIVESSTGGRGGGTADVSPYGPFFIVAADGAWIRASYEEQHSKLAAAISEPGRALGYLFLDKIFQLTVTVPSISATRQRAYLTKLLEANEKDVGERSRERARVEATIRRSRTQAEIHEAWKSASDEVREDVAPLAVERLTDEAVRAETEHELQKFAPLLDRNPRQMKRFLNTYTADLVTSGIEDNFVDPDSLAVWTILRMRWPTFADYLSANPDAVDRLGELPPPENLDTGLRAAFNLRETRDVVTFGHGGPLTAELVRRLAGHSASSTPTGTTPGDEADT